MTIYTRTVHASAFPPDRDLAKVGLKAIRTDPTLLAEFPWIAVCRETNLVFVDVSTRTVDLIRIQDTSLRIWIDVVPEERIEVTWVVP